MGRLAFEKYEGLGNDFVIVEAEDEAEASEALARRVCDRRFGVGADGVLVVLPAGGDAAGRMKVINTDGSVPEMCGNGLRCVALYVARRRRLRNAELSFETGAGLRTCIVEDDGETGMVTVDMGAVRFVADRVVAVDGTDVELAVADAGNPHAVTFRYPERSVLDALGARLATHPSFPHGTNVEFARVRGDAIDLVVWERGCGITLACGTGACATVAVACEKGLVHWDEPVTVHLPGGALRVTMRKADGHAVMRGPARRVFAGVLDERLLR